MQTLASYLIQQLPRGMTYADARQLCLRLYCIADGVPEILRVTLTRSSLADAFAELASARWIPDAATQSSESYHWLEVIDSIFKHGPGVLDIPHGEALAHKVGFRQTL